VPTLSIIIPVFNGSAHLAQCLREVERSQAPVLECIVVDDGSTDDSAAVAAAAGALVLNTSGRRGPASARNLGAATARGEVLLFMDADVCVHRETIGRFLARFEADASIDAIIGSYDDEPADPGFVSQYKNLLHHYVHQNGCSESAVFWTGCGAIRRDVFEASGGFDGSYSRPCIEDIDLGYRLREAGRRIVLDAAIQATHLKRWRLTALLRSDIFDRALPWTRLILHSSELPNDLNLAVSQRLSGVLMLTSAGLLAAGLHYSVALALSIVPLSGVIALNWKFYHFLARKRGLWFAVRALPLHLSYLLYSILAFGAGALLHLFDRRERKPAHVAATVPVHEAEPVERR
jgi:glycosyltransferase involved in cell wall biosynthesis